MKTFHERIGELVEGCCVFQADEEIVMTANTGKDGYVGFNIFDGTIRFMEDETHELLQIEKDLAFKKYQPILPHMNHFSRSETEELATTVLNR